METSAVLAPGVFSEQSEHGYCETAKNVHSRLRQNAMYLVRWLVRTAPSHETWQVPSIHTDLAGVFVEIWTTESGGCLELCLRRTVQSSASTFTPFRCRLHGQQWTFRSTSGADVVLRVERIKLLATQTSSSAKFITMLANFSLSTVTVASRDTRNCPSYGTCDRITHTHHGFLVRPHFLSGVTDACLGLTCSR